MGLDGQRPDEAIHVRGWLKWLERQPVDCVICKRILFNTELHGGQIKSLNISGLEMTCADQVFHLSVCVPDRQRERGWRATS